MSEEKKLLGVASSPHVSSPTGTRSLMLDVLIALLPALCAAVYFFGPRALIATVISVVACEFFEWGYRKLLHKPQSNGDLSAAVTGVLLAFVCPVTLPYWTLVIGDLFAIVVVKQLFGGLGKNFLNPALAGRAFLMLSHPVAMPPWVKPGSENSAGLVSAADAVTGATPLSVDYMHSGNLQGLIDSGVDLADMFIGNVGGCIGEVSAVLLLIGGLYLIFRGVIKPHIPVAFIGTVAVLTFLFPQGGSDRLTWMLYELLGGGLFLGAFFMATDYVTSPTSSLGEVIFGIGCGLLTVFIRYFGGYPEGVSYAILIMNVCAWLIDQVCRPSRFGMTKELKEKLKAAKKVAKEGSAS